MRRNITVGLHSIHEGRSASARQHSQRRNVDPAVVRREDVQVYRDPEARVKAQGSLQCIHPFHLHSHGAGEVQLDGRHQTGHHNHGTGGAHLDGRQRPGLSGSAATPTSTAPSLSIYEWGSHYSYSSSGTTSRGQETRRQAA